ncbi:hypothetical protein MBCUT_12680 [Methanobrevibacter cuticularis]|uniref:Uncharacterized protein n=1 Tax=Methanobrevibacter cuticularis TaxID=47311 RepID=A0A166DMR0_9EURY|nr:DUF4325 domain-containing protein [Methanobrevibacter cuticularis]KZX15765.1 hypothetical protein MBCUT_12680 [Methanobrevibacter cuticularis]
MKVKEIKIEKEIYKKLGMRESAESFFKNLDNDVPTIIIDFDNVEFMSRSFAQEYIYQKTQRKNKIEETNMSKFVKSMYDVVCNDYKKHLTNL